MKKCSVCFSAPVHFAIFLRTRIFSNRMCTCEPNAIVFYFLFPLSLILTSMYVCVCRKLNKMKYMRDLMLDFQSKILQNLRPNLRIGEKCFLRCAYAGCSQQSWARHQWRVVWTSRRNVASAEWYSSPMCVHKYYLPVVLYLIFSSAVWHPSSRTCEGSFTRYRNIRKTGKLSTMKEKRS